VWGLFNGLLIIGFRLPPFVATLATMGIARGSGKLLARHITGLGTSVTVRGEAFGFLGSGQLFGFLPTPIVVMAVIVAAGHYVLNHTRLGRYTFAIGSNVQAARYSGIAVSRYTLYVYVILGTLAGVAGMIQASINSGGIATTAQGYELHVIAAVVIGGGSLSGGAGTILGTVAGALIMAVIRNGCILLGVVEDWQQVIVGVLIVVAVAFDTYRRRRSGA
jgi:ribose transport system permease protein